MYVRPNYASKKLLEDAVKEGDLVEVFLPDFSGQIPDSISAVEGPHYPESTVWYAQVKVEAGRVVKVIS